MPSDNVEETRIIPCQACGGDGGWSYFTGGYSIRDGSADEAWEVCNYCNGQKEEEIEVTSITIEDLDRDRRFL